MILVDSSVWVVFLRGTRRVGADELRRLMRDQPHDIALTEPVAMEVLAGVRPPDLHRVGTMLDALPILSVSPHEDYRQAAFIYHAVRASGHTVRSLNDCLIGAVALRHDAVLLDDDRDFRRIAQVTSLRRWRETG